MIKVFLRQMHKLYSNKCQIKFMWCFDQGGCTSPHNITYVVQMGYPQNFDRQGHNPDRLTGTNHSADWFCRNYDSVGILSVGILGRIPFKAPKGDQFLKINDGKWSKLCKLSYNSSDIMTRIDKITLGKITSIPIIDWQF